MTDPLPGRTTRRRFLIGAGGTVLLAALPSGRAATTPASMQAAVKVVTGDAPVREGRIKLNCLLVGQAQFLGSGRAR
jgi:hypothetical protein